MRAHRLNAFQHYRQLAGLLTQPGKHGGHGGRVMLIVLAVLMPIMELNQWVK
jgi:type II secretory pathway component PulF